MQIILVFVFVMEGAKIPEGLARPCVCALNGSVSFDVMLIFSVSFSLCVCVFVCLLAV